MIDAKRLAELMAPGELRGLAEYLGNMGEANQMIVPEREALDSAVAVLREVAGRTTDKVIELKIAPGDCNDDCPLYRWDSADETPTCLVDDGTPGCYLKRVGGGRVIVQAKK